MSTLAETVKRVKAFKFETAILNIVKSNEDYITDLNTDSQLFDRGIDSTGTLLPGPYAPFTIAYKNYASQPTDRITLRDSGDFHNSFFVDASKFPFTIDATDSKTAELKTEWGADIFGLTSESKNDLSAYILQDVHQALRNGIL